MVNKKRDVTNGRNRKVNFLHFVFGWPKLEKTKHELL